MNQNIKLVDVYRDLGYVGAEPITLAEAKAWLYVDHSDDDNLITGLITQSRSAVEDYCNISVLYKTITATLQNVGILEAPSWMSRWDYSFYGISAAGCWFELPYGPVVSVSSVTSINADGSIITLAANQEYFLRGTEFKQIKINSWSNNILVVYVALYATIPQGLKLAILNEISFRYKNRGSMTNRYQQQNVGASEGTKTLAFPFIRPWI